MVCSFWVVRSFEHCLFSLCFAHKYQHLIFYIYIISFVVIFLYKPHLHTENQYFSSFHFLYDSILLFFSDFSSSNKWLTIKTRVFLSVQCVVICNRNSSLFRLSKISSTRFWKAPVFFVKKLFFNYSNIWSKLPQKHKP